VSGALYIRDLQEKLVRLRAIRANSREARVYQERLIRHIRDVIDKPLTNSR